MGIFFIVWRRHKRKHFISTKTCQCNTYIKIFMSCYQRNMIKLLLSRSRYTLNHNINAWRCCYTAQKQELQGITISDSCVQKLKQLCDADTFLRLCVESGGCSGFQYKFNIDDTLTKDDRVFDREGVRIVIDDTSLNYIRGATVDYHTELIRSAFRVVHNPNADLGCSCGASFSIKID